jgi:hypothetical protein
MSGAYPISKLLSEIVGNDLSSEVAFVTERLGYRDALKAIRRIHLWTGSGEGHRRIIDQLARATGRGEELERAIVATREQRAKEYEAAWLERCKAEAETFLPFVCARGEHRIPTQITFHGLTRGRLELVQVPREIFELPLQEQLEAMPKYMREYASEYRGVVPFFGQLQGFIYARLLDHFTFDREGHLIGKIDSPFRRGYSVVTLR